MYGITIYLRSNYNREKQKAEERAAMIETQNIQIRLQNDQLQRLNQEKNKMLSVLGHDLRSPLNAITTVLDFLTNYEVSEEQRMQLKRDLLHTTRNASDILSNLLAWSSGQMKGLQPHIEKINLPQLLGKVVQGQQLQADKKEIRVIIDAAEDCSVLADFNMLELTLRNLVNNALKFTHRGGEVTIRTVCDKDCVISISDNGIGMSLEQLDTLFTMDIHSTYGTNNETGIGLGLLLCREFTEIQQGTMWVQSQEGSGSTFSIRLPAGPAA
jgi:two-component system, sensor histidine kinase and response regulator